jgi:hypothetical protein
MTWDLLLFLTATPHVTDAATTVLRLLAATLERGARVQVWACGSATLLTHRSLGEVKPHDMRNLGTDHPSTATVIDDLLAAAPDRACWNACRFCSADRGAVHIDAVRVRSPLRIAEFVGAARNTVYIGGP